LLFIFPLRALRESGLPTVRNKKGRHGQEGDLIVVPEYLARYVFNMTAAILLFLVDANTVKK
jgi:hypothetical protein